MASINTKDHSTYIEVAWADPGLVIRKSVFSIAAYRAVLKQKGVTSPHFDKEVESMFKKGPRGSWAPDATKVPIRQVMLVCQRENGINVKYSDSDGFGRPGMMGLWDLHSSDALNRAKMQLPSGPVDANFCPCCAFYSTNETLNNHVRKHYGMGLTCRSDGFMTASVATMKRAHGDKARIRRQARRCGEETKGKRLKQRLGRRCSFSRTILRTVLHPATTHAHAGIDTFIRIDASNRRSHQRRRRLG